MKISGLGVKHSARIETLLFRKLNTFIEALAKSEFQKSVITSKNMIALPVTVRLGDGLAFYIVKLGTKAD